MGVQGTIQTKDVIIIEIVTPKTQTKMSIKSNMNPKNQELKQTKMNNLKYQ